MSIYTELLFLHGHVVQPELARSLAGVPEPSAQAREEPGRRPRQHGEVPAVCRHGAIDAVCGATALSPFR